MIQRPPQLREYKTGNKMLEELYMRDLANAMKMPEEPLPAGKVTVSAPDPEMAGMDKAFVGTRLNVPKAGQPTQQDREKMAIGLLDTLAGALRGAAAQVGGLPGDIRSILDMINQEGAEKYLGQRSFATTEEILKDTSVRVPGTQIDVPFPPVLKEGVPNREERQKAVDVAQEVGTFLPAPGVPELAIQGARAAARGAKALGPKAAQMSEDYLRSIGGITDIVPSAANAWANPKAFMAQIDDAAQKQNMELIDKNMRQYVEQGLTFSKVRKELEKDIGLKLSKDQLDYVDGFVDAKRKMVSPKSNLTKLDDGLSYQGQHKPPMRDSGAPLSDVTGGGKIYPEDVYSANGQKYYGDGSPRDGASFAIVNQFKGKPNASVTIYRAVPSSEKVSAKNIQKGDWVTINREYAKEHGEGTLNGDYKIISKKVKASDIFTNGDSIHEWGYDPSKKNIKENK